MEKILEKNTNLPEINKRVYDLVEKETEGNVSKFADKIGISQQSFSRIFSIDKRNNKFPTVSDSIIDAICNTFGIDKSWLLVGVGNNPINEKPKKVQQNKVDTDSYLLVPIIHVDSVGGMHSPNAITDQKQYIESYIPFVDAKSTDVCIVESGDSMQPTIPSGSILLLREIPNWKEYFGFGNIFVIELKDGRRITKEITRYDENPKDYVWCKSHNSDVPDEELPKSMIVSVWKVIKILINKGF